MRASSLLAGAVLLSSIPAALADFPGRLPANTVLANPTASEQPAVAAALPSCNDLDGQHLNYVAGTGFTCGTSAATTCPNPVGVQYQVLIRGNAFDCTDSTIRDDGNIISATLVLTVGSFSGEIGSKPVWKFDPQNAHIAIGEQAGVGADSGSISIGLEAGRNVTSPPGIDESIAIGNWAGFDSLGLWSVFLGSSAGQETDGSGLIAIGNNAGVEHTQNDLIAIGTSAAYQTVPSRGPLIAIGPSAAYQALNTFHTIAIGAFAAKDSDDCDDSIIIGDSAGIECRDVGDLIAIGTGTGVRNNALSAAGGAGSFSIAIGAGTLSAVADSAGNTGQEVVALGHNAVSDRLVGGGSNTLSNTGDEVIAIGHFAGAGNSGDNVLAIGTEAGYRNSGSNVIILSHNDPGTNTISNYIDIGEVWKATGIDTPATSVTTIEGTLKAGASTGAAALSPSTFQAVGTGAGWRSTFIQVSNDDHAPSLALAKSRGTAVGTPGAVLDGGLLGHLSQWADDGSTGPFDVQTAALEYRVSGTVSTGVVPAAIDFRTMNTAGVYDRRVRLHPSGGLYLGSTGTVDPGAGNILLNGGFVRFIDLSSSSPALKRSSALLQVRLGDDSAYADLEASKLRTSTAYTVATLPAAGVAGRRAYVTDATAPTFLGTLVGGGSVVTPVFDNGTDWVAN